MPSVTAQLRSRSHTTRSAAADVLLRSQAIRGGGNPPGDTAPAKGVVLLGGFILREAGQ